MTDDRPPSRRAATGWAAPLRRLARFGAGLGAALIGLLALAWLALHWLILPHIDEWRPELEQRASRALGVPVRIGSISVRSSGWMPSVAVGNVELLDAERRVALRLPSVLATLSPRSLLSLELRLEQLLVDGAELDVRRLPDGRIAVAGLALGGDDAGGGDDGTLDWFFRQREFVIRGGTLRWVDELRGAPPLALSDVQIVVRNGFRRHDARIDATPPVEWGDRFTLQGRFVAPLLARSGDWRRWSGTAHLALPRADVRELRRHVQLPFDLSEGNGALRAWLTVEQGEARALTADVALRAVELRLARDVEPLAFENLEGRLGIERSGDRTAVEVRRLGFVTGDGIRWPPGDLKLAWRQRPDGEVEGGEIHADRLDIGGMAAIAERVPMGAALRKLLAELRPQGLVSGVDATWQGPLDAPRRYTVSGRLAGLSLAAHPAADPEAIGRPGLSNAALQLRATEAGGQARVSIVDGTLELPGVFADPTLRLARFDSQLAWTLAPAGDGAPPAVMVQMKDARFANADVTGELNATWRSGSGAAAPPAGVVRKALARAAGVRASTPAPAPPAGSERPYPGRLELDGTLTDAAALRTARYLPLGLPAETRDYVERAVRGGRITRATFRVDGDLAEFPFRAGRPGQPGTGEFHVAAQLDGVTLAYAPGARTAGGGRAPDPWPALTQASGELVVDRTSLEVRNVRGRLGGVDWTGVRAAIPNVGEHAVVSIDGSGRGALAEMLQFLRASPVGGWTGHALANASATGNAEMKLALAIPLDESAESSVKGSLALAGNDVRITPGTPLLGSARGRVDFTHKGFSVIGASARMLGGEVTFDGGSAGPDTQRFNGQGTFSADALRRAGELGLVARLGAYISGQAAYRASLSFVKGMPQFTLTSNLAGLAVDLPYPLGKAAATPLPFRYQTALEADSLAAGRTPLETLQIDAGSVLRARYLREASGDEPRILRGDLRVTDGLSSGAPPAPALAGVAAGANSALIELRQVDVDAWERVLDRIVADPAASSAPAEPRPRGAARDLGVAPEPSASYQPDDVVIRTGELKSSGRRVTRLGAMLAERGGVWHANVVADQLAGSIEYRTPRRVEGAGRIHARLARLSLPKDDVAAVETLVDAKPAAAATSLPALDVVVDAFELRGRSLGRLEIEAANRVGAGGRAAGRDWQLSKFNLTMPEAQFVASGTWAAGEAGAPRRVALGFKLAIGDSGALLARFGMPGAIRGGKGQLAGDVAWAGSPLSPDLKGMQGQINVAIDSGQFLKASPGAARLLGVLSLQSLPRRLTLDFRDLFQDGFAFDSVVGDVRIGDGQATTNNLRMRGAAAAVLMEGSADLERETQDLRVVVVPEINAGTASLAYAIINPAIGLGTFLAQLLLRKPLIAAGTREFHISGSWDDPKVERVERRRPEIAGANAGPEPPSTADPVAR
ncbi:YhdP family protein [Piscinibacter koreensis]|uniref:YhdP family protein n=1 Tax=Piscinibacter koreensis TaxID=2742824 RepID=UPI001590B330